MAMASPSLSLPALLELHALRPDGSRVRIGELTRGRAAALVFLRHFG